MPRNWKFTQYINLIVALLLAVTLMHFGASCGLILTPDSEQYLIAAKEIDTAGRWPGDYDSSYLYWPPLFPLILSLLEYPDTQLLVINSAVLVAIGILLYQVSFGIINDVRIRMAFVSTSLLNVHMVMTCVFLWSELIFILLLMTSLFCFFKTQDNKANKMHFALLLLSLCLLCLQRYAGLLIVFGIAGSLVIQKNDEHLKQRVLRGSILIAVPVILIFAWWYYVSRHHPDVTFLKRFSASVVGDNFYLMLQTLSKIFFPVPGVAGVMLLVALVGVIGVLLRKQFSDATRVKQLVLVISCYLSGFVLLGDLRADEIDRYLSVVMPVVMLITFFILDQMSALWRKHIQLAFLIGIYLWMAYPLYRTLNNAGRWPERSCNETRLENRTLDP